MIRGRRRHLKNGTVIERRRPSPNAEGRSLGRARERLSFSRYRWLGGPPPTHPRENF